jgi:hypothetical protein
MLVRNLLLVTLTVSSFGRAFGDLIDWWQGAADEYKNLEKCPGRLENRHYNIDVDVDYLPETCTDEQLVVIGWLIEDAIQDMEEMAPKYQVRSFENRTCCVECALSLTNLVLFYEIRERNGLLLCALCHK